MSAQRQRRGEPRGVYEYDHTIDGCPAYYAVKENGDRLEKIVVVRHGRVAEAVAWLWRKLDAEDPPGPKLRLVTDSPPAPARPRAMTYAEIEQIDDPIRRMVLHRKKMAAEGKLPRIPYFR
jgi:hypothetical protein